MVEDLLPRVNRQIATAWEQLVREWVDRTAPAAVTGGAVTAVGASAADSRQAMDSAGNQIDVVAVDRQPSGRRIVRLLGEAKHRTRPTGLSELQRLELLRERLGPPKLACSWLRPAGSTPTLNASPASAATSNCSTPPASTTAEPACARIYEASWSDLRRATRANPRK